jgi:hypothetical protein
VAGVGRFAVCSFVERQDDGAAFAAGALPLHVTVVGRFSVAAAPDAVLGVLRDVAEDLPCPLRLGTDGLDGSPDVPVLVIEDAAAAHALHDRLLTELRQLGAVVDTPRAAGPDWVPSGDGAARGDELARFAADGALTIGTLSLVELEPDGDADRRRVLATV